MTKRWTGWLAWMLWALVFAALVFTMAFGAASSVDVWTQIPVLVTYALFLLAFSTVGVLIASRRARNPIGWILLGSAAAYAVGGLSAIPADSLLGAPEVLQAWLRSWVWSLGIALAGTFLLLLFPDGALPSRRWRPVAWVAGVGIATTVLGLAFAPVLAAGSVRNPVGASGVAGRFFEILQLGQILVAGAILASVLSIVVRFRRAAPVERQQLKWLTYAAGLVLLAFVGGVLVYEVAGGSEAGENLQYALVTGALACVPIAIGVAILRHRLYDIDRIINRTLVYIPLLAIIGGLSTATIPFSQRVFIALSGNESDAAIVLTTLLMASLVTPVRKRLEGLVEGRFKQAQHRASLSADGQGTPGHPEVEARIRSLAERVEALERARRGTEARSPWEPDR